MKTKDQQSVPVRLLRIVAILVGGLLVAGSLCTCPEEYNWCYVHVTVNFDPEVVSSGSSESLLIGLDTDGTDMSSWTNLDYYEVLLLPPGTLSSYGKMFKEVTNGMYYIGACIDMNGDNDVDDSEDYVGFYGAIDPATDPANAEVGPDFTAEFSFTIQ